MNKDILVSEQFDKTVNIEMNLDFHQGRTQVRYDLARQKQGAPLTYLAARGLVDRVAEGDFIFLLGGAGLSPWLEYGETDGPPGIISLARSLELGLGARPVFIGDEQHLGPILACGRAAGILVLDRDAVENKKVGHTGLAIPFPLGPQGAKEQAKKLIDEYGPKAVIAVEKQAPNERGVFHTSRGWKLPSSGQAHVFQIALEAQQRGIFTVGIGDGGNEIGYGLIEEEYNRVFLESFGVSCQCGCGGGQATNVGTDILVTATTSNWGAYGVSACLAYLLEKRELLQDVEMERRMLEAATLAGAMDVVHGTVPYVDGTSLSAQQAIIATLQEILRNALSRERNTIFPPDYNEIVQQMD